MSAADLGAHLAPWHDFFITAGAASASLLGLLFVALTLNIEEVTDPEQPMLLLLAEQSFSSWLTVLFLSLFALVPSQQPAGFASELAIVAGLGLVRSSVNGVRVGRRGQLPWGWRHAVRRFAMPGLADIALLVIAANVATGSWPDTVWLILATVLLVISAAEASWDLLARVGIERRARRDH